MKCCGVGAQLRPVTKVMIISLSYYGDTAALKISVAQANMDTARGTRQIRFCFICPTVSPVLGLLQ